MFFFNKPLFFSFVYIKLVNSLPSDDMFVVTSLSCFAVCCYYYGNSNIIGMVIVYIIGVISADTSVFHGSMLITSKSC